MQTIAALPNGAVVLPGLDLSLDDESWESLADHPEHPQAGMAELLRKLGVSRRDVTYVAGSAPDGPARARLHLVSEALRPAETTEHWQRYLESDELAPEGRASFANALTGMRLVVAPTAHDEAEAIALILKSCIEDAGQDRGARHARTAFWRGASRRDSKAMGFAIDDSAGMPIARTVPGAFLDLVLGAAETNFAPPELMALLKHPLARLGREPAAIRNLARMLERGAFRDIYVGQGLAGVAHALKAERQRRHFCPKTSVTMHLVSLPTLRRAFEPLSAFFATTSSAQCRAVRRGAWRRPPRA